jgi:hypothetical protein
MASEWIQTVEGVRSATQAVGQRAEMRKHANLLRPSAGSVARTDTSSGFGTLLGARSSGVG